MNQPIVGFHRDDDGHWIAELGCGHRQHLRHDPPWHDREWVLTEAGRHARIGSLLECTQCDNREKGLSMHYMVIERFKNDDPVPVYRRFRDHGRLMPDGLEYVSSWITHDMSMCWQIMKCDDRRLLDEWMSNWKDIMDFEVIPVITSPEAREKIAPRLGPRS